MVVVASVASASLFGCGSTPAPTPAPYAPTTVAAAWANHFEAFGTQNVAQIMLDYDEDSVLQIFNDGCSPAGVLQEFVGVAPIKGFFEGLFATLTPTPGLNVPDFTVDVANPTVYEPSGESFAPATVFLVWQSVDQGIDKATDTFLWKEVDSVVKVKKQNIVATEPGACPATPDPNPTAPTPDPDSPITMGWNNHLDGFGTQNRTQILLDYTDTSTVEVWTWGMADKEGYKTYVGLDQIGGMFDELWAGMNAQKDAAESIGLEIAAEFPRVEDGKQSVFLVWQSYSNPKATDSFSFDDAGMIIHQTIVTTAGGVAPTLNKVVV